MRRPSDRLLTRFWIEGGGAFRGLFLPPPDQGGLGSSPAPVRFILRAREDAAVRVRDVFRDSAGQRFLAADHFHRPGVDRTFKIFRMDAQVVWRRPRTEPDPLTDRPVSIAPQILGTIWAAFEIARRTEPEPALRVETDPRLVITGALLRINDTLDGRRVKRVNEELGVTVAELA